MKIVPVRGLLRPVLKSLILRKIGVLQLPWLV